MCIIYILKYAPKFGLHLIFVTQLVMQYTGIGLFCLLSLILNIYTVNMFCFLFTGPAISIRFLVVEVVSKPYRKVERNRR